MKKNENEQEKKGFAMKELGFERIAGYKSEKKELQNLSTLLHRFEEMHAMGVRLPHGLLLVGDPGVGKTVMAETLIDGSGVRCVRVACGRIEENKIYEHLDQAFREAAESTPSIVFIDEMDKLVGELDHYRSSYNFANTRKILQVLNDHKDDDVFVVATVNDIDMLSHALKRSGRFDRILTIPLPNADDRREIIEFYGRNKPIHAEVDREMLVKLTAGMSGADIECLFNEAGIHALLRKGKTIRQQDFDYAIEQKLFEGVSREVTLSEEQKLIVATHEAGHAVIALIRNPERLNTISILPQGESEGHCGVAPAGSGTDPDLRKMLDVVTELLGGKACESVFFPDKVFLNSSSDIRRAMFYAENLVATEGAFGFQYVPRKDSPSAFGGDNTERKKDLIDQKCEELLDSCYRDAVETIREHRTLANAIARRLMKNYSLGREEVMRLYANYKNKRECRAKVDKTSACA